uniref:Fork-head domain-containing protein n=1 Tax=Ascaris lumbricoides TaxID=6252 RepID=A0A0M3HTG1_ASCLU
MALLITILHIALWPTSSFKHQKITLKLFECSLRIEVERFTYENEAIASGDRTMGREEFEVSEGIVASQSALLVHSCQLMSSTSTAALCTAQETAPGLFNRCERSACSRNVGVLRRDVMPSSPLIAPTLSYPSNAERVVDHDPLAMTSESKHSELFSILGEDSELRRLRTEDNAEKSSNLPSKINLNNSRDSIAISLGSHQKRFQGRAKSKKMPRKKNLPDVASTSSSEYFSGCPDTNSQASANSSSYRKTGVHYYHPYNKPSIYESSPKLVHKKCNLRSTAPVLYDLLSDECEAENRDRSNTIPYTSTLATELCRSVDLYLNPLPLPLPLISTSTLPLLAPHDQRPIAYFNNFMQQSMLMNSAPMNLLKMVQPTNSASHWPAAPAPSQSPWNNQLCKQAENLPAEPEVFVPDRNAVDPENAYPR